MTQQEVSAMQELRVAAKLQARDLACLDEQEDHVENNIFSSYKEQGLRSIPTQTTIAPSPSSNTLCHVDSRMSLCTLVSGAARETVNMTDGSSTPADADSPSTATSSKTSSKMVPDHDVEETKLMKAPLTTSRTVEEIIEGASTSVAAMMPSATSMEGASPMKGCDILYDLPLARDPLPEGSVRKQAFDLFLPALLLYRFSFLLFLWDGTAVERTSEWLGGGVGEFLRADTVCAMLALEMWTVIAACATVIHWKDCGHWVSLWIFLVYTNVCGFRFYLYAHPLEFVPLLVATCCLPFLPQWIQIHSRNTAANEVRLPPFPAKKIDTVDTYYQRGGLFQTPAYLGQTMASTITNPSLRWGITLFLYAFPFIGGLIGMYRGYMAATDVAPVQHADLSLQTQDTVNLLVYIVLVMASCAIVCDMAWYLIGIYSLARLGGHNKTSKEVYTTEAYQPPKLDNDAIEKIIAKAKYLKATGGVTAVGAPPLPFYARKHYLDAIETPVATEFFKKQGGASRSSSRALGECSTSASSSSSSSSSDEETSSTVSAELSSKVKDFLNADVEEAACLADEIFQPMTVVLPAYMPNEEEIIMDVLRYYKAEEPKYPGGFKILLVWNSPKTGDAHKDIIRELAEFEKEWPKFKGMRIMDSTCKADNLNVAIRMLDTPFALFNDSDTIVSAETMCRAAVHIFGPEQYDVAQSRNIYCKDDYEGYPEGASEGFRPTTALMAFRDSFSQANLFMGHLFERTNFNGRGGFWRTKAVKDVEFDTRTLAEDHDASCRAFMYFGYRGVLDNNMLCQEREPATFETVNKQRRRWMHCALQIMDRTIAWNWASRFSQGLLERWVYWYSYTEARTPVETQIFYLFYFEIFGLCFRAHNIVEAGACRTAYYFLLYVGVVCFFLRMVYVALMVSQCRYNPGWMRVCLPLHMISGVLQGCYQKLFAYHDYYWGTGKWVCTARATNIAAVPSATTSGSTLTKPLLNKD
ncbi:unnamed protein product [Amoebophrya sp. A25]|nr:unnamed protein product [Amoebophrya sp. A25]|eukprot:GSA25T00004794001.1